MKLSSLPLFHSPLLLITRSTYTDISNGLTTRSSLRNSNRPREREVNIRKIVQTNKETQTANTPVCLHPMNKPGRFVWAFR
jgi:hypothetical protein